MSSMYLSVEDYVVLCICLFITACIGTAFRCVGGKQKNNEEFFLAGRSMSVFPVAFSMMATFMSSTTLMGIPSEIYRFGTPMILMEVGFVAGIVFAAYVFLPLFHVVQVNTAYEYLEKRFGKLSRKLMSALCILHLVIFTAINLYAPALAINSVTGIPSWLSVVTTGLLCTFYCTMGGMKAVLWTDVFQTFLMYACLIAIIISGSLYVGGFLEIFSVSYEGGRLILPTYNINFPTRYTVWSIFLQGFVISASSFGTSQEQVQRVLVVENAKKSQRAALLSLPMIILFHFLTCLCGLTIYAYFRNCDPIKGKFIDTPDQLVPYYIMSALGNMKGLPGLCVAGIFSASLSTVSSQVNSLAALTLEDFLVPVFSISRSANNSKGLTVFYGLLCLGLTFAVPYLGTIMEMTLSIVGTFSGICFSFYLLAALSKRANEKGSIIGIIAGFIVGVFLCVAGVRNKYPSLPTSTDCLGMKNNTEFISNITAMTSIERDNFPISYMWDTSIASLVTLVVGYAASIIINCFQGVPVVDDKFISPIRLWFGKTSDEPKKVPKLQPTVEIKNYSESTKL